MSFQDFLKSELTAKPLPPGKPLVFLAQDEEITPSFKARLDSLSKEKQGFAHLKEAARAAPRSASPIGKGIGDVLKSQRGGSPAPPEKLSFTEFLTKRKASPSR